MYVCCMYVSVLVDHEDDYDEWEREKEREREKEKIEN
jgi:hypothetical protein